MSAAAGICIYVVIFLLEEYKEETSYAPYWGREDNEYWVDPNMR